MVFLPGAGRIRLIDRWAAGYDVDRQTALEATYIRGSHILKGKSAAVQVFGLDQ